MPQIYSFQSFQLNVRERQLTCEGRVIRLHAKVFDTLVVLISEAGRLMRKDVLMKAIWPDHVVEENNLQHNLENVSYIPVIHVRSGKKEGRAQSEYR